MRKQDADADGDGRAGQGFPQRVLHAITGRTSLLSRSRVEHNTNREGTDHDHDHDHDDGGGGGGGEGEGKGTLVRWFFTTLRQSVSDMRHVPRSMWVVFVLKVLESFAYFSMMLSLVIFLSDELEFSDARAGWFYGSVGVLTSLFGVLTGPIIDALGVRRSIVLGAVISAAGRFFFALTSDRTMAYAMGLVVMPFGMALGIPVLTIAVKRYSGEENRTLSFGLYYTVMNVAALLSGHATDACNALIPAHGITLLGTQLSPLRVLFLVGVVVTLLQVCVAWSLKDISVSAQGQVEQFDPMESLRTSEGRGARLREVSHTCRDPRFWKLVALSCILLGVRMVFRHLDATLPKWMMREIGEHALYGSVYSINPAMVIVLVPIVAATTRHWDPYRMITRGAAVSATSVFWLCLDGAYWNAVAFVVQLSLGEAVYSPKVYEYTMAIAPKGKEGLYTMLATAPLFAAKFAVGGMSGTLLEAYCPETGPRECWKVWLFIGLTSVTSPILLVCCAKWISGPSRNELGSAELPMANLASVPGREQAAAADGSEEEEEGGGRWLPQEDDM